MEKPFVVCHMLTSLDGKIDGAYMSDPACAAAREKYSELRGFYSCDAALYGTTTMLGGYSSGRAPDELPDSPAYPMEDYAAPSDVQNYIVSVDPTGVLGWESSYIEKKGRPRAHVIEVLTGQVDPRYLAYLRQFDISYVFAGEETLDCALLLHKLKTMFGIEKLMVAGGGLINWSFAQAGLLDEVSVVMAPVADGSTSAVSIFEKADFLPERKPLAFALKEMERVNGGGLWLRYTPK
jgi:riboflavin biosynthesis pyrimidine reductase